jgi:proteasome beta subunit
MEEKEKDKLMKTGTTTLGLVCKDGIILAADKRVSAGYMIASKKFKKIIQIADNMAVTIAGLVSDAQLLSKLIKAEVKLKDIQTGRKSTVEESANLLAGIVYSNIRKMSMVPGIVGFLLGGKDEKGYHLFNLGIDGSLTEVDDYTSDGSGSIFAIGVLETLYKKGMSVEEGIKVTLKSMNAALQRDMATGNGVDIITITDQGVKTVLEKEIDYRIE